MAPVTPSAASSTELETSSVAPTRSPRWTRAYSLASSSSNLLAAASIALIALGSSAMARRASTRALKTLRSPSSSLRRAPLASTICVWAKCVSANAVSACWAAMIRGTTPVVTRSWALCSASMLTRLTAMIAAVSARIAPKQRPSLTDRRMFPTRGMRRGDGRRIAR